MKKIYLLTFLICIGNIFHATPILAQCCPYIDSIIFLPENPNITDTIYMVTTVTTPGQGSYLGYTTSNNSGETAVEACYYSGPLTALQTYTDTINLGIYAAGTHQINFNAILSIELETCMPADSNNTNGTIEVTGPLNTTATTSGTNLYPNPVTDVLNIVSNKPIVKAELHDLTGKVLRSLSAVEVRKQQIDMNLLKEGVYFFHIYFADGTEEVRKILRQR